jgi:hypothetical protein
MPAGFVGVLVEIFFGFGPPPPLVSATPPPGICASGFCCVFFLALTPLADAFFDSFGVFGIRESVEIGVTIQ